MKRIVPLLAMAGGLLTAALYAIPCAQAATTTYHATLSGPAENPPNASPGTGLAVIIIDDVANTLNLNIPFTDLLGTTTASHIHCCTTTPLAGSAGVATQVPVFMDFPLGVTAGTYSHVFDLNDAASYNPAFITANGGTVGGALSAFLTGVGANEAYLNIHTTLYPAGEIRGFLVAAPVPEPAAWALLAAGLCGIGAWRRRRA
ncbi:MAG: CHRD domain-containing protein [Pseudomonadota bacterium]